MIVVAGEALVDLVIGTDGSVTAKLGGGPYNTARTIGRLGRPVTFLGALSWDRFGTRLFDHLVADGVQPDGIVRTELPTTLAVAELDDRGAATYRFYLAGTSATALSLVPDAVRTPEAVHAGTLGLVLEPTAFTIEQYLGQLPADTLVMLDPNCRPRVVTDLAAFLARMQRLFRMSHVIKVSTDDIEYLSPGAEPLDYARSLLAHGPRAVLVTAGGEGAWAVTESDETMVAASPIDLVDTIGAGDSFGGAFLTWWLDHDLGPDDFHDHDAVVAAIDAAQEVAASTCQQVGAEPPHRHQLSRRWQLAPR